MRSERSLVQTCGRASRNVRGKVIMYADNLTRSMENAIAETDRRRKIQTLYNEEHGITPETIKKEITSVFDNLYDGDISEGKVAEDVTAFQSLEKIDKHIEKLEKEMHRAAKDLAFEKAAELRDRIEVLKEKAVFTL